MYHWPARRCWVVADLSYACWNTEQGSEMVGKDSHRLYDEHECKGRESMTPVAMGECQTVTAGVSSVRYVSRATR